MRARKGEGASCLRLLRRIEDVGAQFVAAHEAACDGLNLPRAFRRDRRLPIQPLPHEPLAYVKLGGECRLGETLFPQVLVDVHGTEY